MIQEKETRHRVEGLIAGLRRGFGGLLLMIVIVGFAGLILGLFR